MKSVITIHEAKTHLSRYIKQAKAGQKIYMGSYGQPEVMLVVADQNSKPGKRALGIWADKPLGYYDKDVLGSDQSIIADFDKSINQPFVS